VQSRHARFCQSLRVNHDLHLLPNTHPFLFFCFLPCQEHQAATAALTQRFERALAEAGAEAAALATKVDAAAAAAARELDALRNNNNRIAAAAAADLAALRAELAAASATAAAATDELQRRCDAAVADAAAWRARAAETDAGASSSTAALAAAEQTVVDFKKQLDAAAATAVAESDAATAAALDARAAAAAATRAAVADAQMTADDAAAAAAAALRTQLLDEMDALRTSLTSDHTLHCNSMAALHDDEKMQLETALAAARDEVLAVCSERDAVKTSKGDEAAAERTALRQRLDECGGEIAALQQSVQVGLHLSSHSCLAVEELVCMTICLIITVVVCIRVHIRVTIFYDLLTISLSDIVALKSFERRNRHAESILC
jgi:hypothetical protein